MRRTDCFASRLRRPSPVADSRISSKAPLRILCQHDAGSCGACCGVYNFADRSPAALRRRLVRRTRLVRAAWPDEAALAAVRDQLLDEERPSFLFAAVKVCPYAGLIEGDVDGDVDAADASGDRVGCLLHPLRHPEGKDLRDLAVYPREVCAGHFCASHDWLRSREQDLAQTARGPLYGRVVTDAGLVKAVARALDDAAAAPVDAAGFARAAARLQALWTLLLMDWPFRDADPRRFGGFAFDGDNASERSLPSCLFGLSVVVTAAERQILDAVGTRALDDEDAGAALDVVRAAIAAVVEAAGAGSAG